VNRRIDPKLKQSMALKELYKFASTVRVIGTSLQPLIHCKRYIEGASVAITGVKNFRLNASFHQIEAKRLQDFFKSYQTMQSTI
jgi:hypothetical protein